MHYQSNVFEAIRLSLKFSWDITALLWHFKWPWFLGAASLAFFSAFFLRKPNARWKPDTRWLIAGAVIVCSATFLLFMPAAYVGGGLPPDRSWVSNSTVILGFFIMIGFILGGLPHKRTTEYVEPLGKFLLPILVFVLGGYQLSLLKRKLPDLQTYSAAYDQRYALLLDLKRSGRTNPIEVSALPPTREYRSAEIASSSQSWVNQCLMKGLELPFEVTQKSNP
jgi:hypothetical protein